MKTAKKNIWTAIEQQIDAGNYPAIFLNAAGEICLDGTANGTTLPKRLAEKFPLEIREQAKQKQVERLAAAKVEADNRIADWKAEEAAKAAKIADWSGQRVWGLSGFFVEEMTGPRYTFEEIQEFESWHGHQQFHRRDADSLTAVCYGSTESVASELIRVKLDRFFDHAGTGDRSKSFAFGPVVKQLEEITAKRRDREAKKN